MYKEELLSRIKQLKTTLENEEANKHLLEEDVKLLSDLMNIAVNIINETSSVSTEGN